jgi:hypothetical protein
MQMPKPTDAHEKLKLLTGIWNGEEHIFPSPWDPAGGTAIGRVKNRSGLDGFVVVQDYQRERNGVVNYWGHGVFSWDAMQQCYILHWWDSMGMPPSIFRGNFNGNVLTLANKEAQGYTRAIWEFPDDRHYLYCMQFSQNGEQWQIFIEGKYLKVDRS